MKSFNGTDIDQTILYVKNNCGKFIIAILERNGWSYTVKKESKLIEPIHPESAKELIITPGTSNEI